MIVEFASAVNSVRAGVAIQRDLERRNADFPKGLHSLLAAAIKTIPLRAGVAIHLDLQALKAPIARDRTLLLSFISAVSTAQYTFQTLLSKQAQVQSAENDALDLHSSWMTHPPRSR